MGVCVAALASIVAPTAAVAAVSLGEFVKAPCVFNCGAAIFAYYQIYSATDFEGASLIKGIEFSQPGGRPLYLPSDFTVFAFYTTQSAEELLRSQQIGSATPIGKFGAFSYQGLLLPSLKLVGSSFEFVPGQGNLLIAVVGDRSYDEFREYLRTDPTTGALSLGFATSQIIHKGDSAAAQVRTAFMADVVELPPLAAVPEPNTWAMMLLGFGAIGHSIRSARRKEKVIVSFGRANSTMSERRWPSRWRRFAAQARPIRMRSGQRGQPSALS
jgi:hypothetical protein